jgi:hypothetical protein
MWGIDPSSLLSFLSCFLSLSKFRTTTHRHLCPTFNHLLESVGKLPTAKGSSEYHTVNERKQKLSSNSEILWHGARCRGLRSLRCVACVNVYVLYVAGMETGFQLCCDGWQHIMLVLVHLA